MVTVTLKASERISYERKVRLTLKEAEELLEAYEEELTDPPDEFIDKWALRDHVSDSDDQEIDEVWIDRLSTWPQFFKRFFRKKV